MRSLLTNSLLASVIALGAATAPTLADVPFKGEEKAAIETIIRDYLIANPEVLIEAMDALQTKQAHAQREARADVIAKAGDALTDAPEGMVLGNPNGDVTVVEFFDYNCGYCRQALEDMNALIEADNNVRFVLKEFPILGPQSIEASRVSLAFRDLAPQKYPEFHRALLARRSMADKASALEVRPYPGAASDSGSRRQSPDQRDALLCHWRRGHPGSGRDRWPETGRREHARMRKGRLQLTLSDAVIGNR